MVTFNVLQSFKNRQSEIFWHEDVSQIQSKINFLFYIFMVVIPTLRISWKILRAVLSFRAGFFVRGFSVCGLCFHFYSSFWNVLR